MFLKRDVCQHFAALKSWQTSFRFCIFDTKYCILHTKGRLPAFVELTFTSNVITTTIINIPAGTKVSTDKGITFETLENVSINVGENSVKVDAKQWIIVLNAVVGTSDGSILQKFPLEVETVDKEMLVTVGGTESFIFVDSFAFTMPTDQVFRPALNVDNILEIRKTSPETIQRMNDMTNMTEIVFE